jgi:hypothetical protein
MILNKSVRRTYIHEFFSIGNDGARRQFMGLIDFFGFKWAGKKRKVEISKNGKQFFPTNRFDTALNYIDNLIAEYKHIDKNDKSGIAQKLAEI